MTLDVSVDCDESCFELPAWGELLKTDPNRHVFATPEWNRLWWDEFGAGKDLRLLTMSREGDVVAIVPLYRKPENERMILRFVGGVDLTDYLGPVCSEDDRDDVAETLVDWLASTDLEWDEFDAHNMPVPFGFAEFLAEKVDRSDLGLILDQEDTSAVLSLPPDWDEYLASLESKDRHELRRKRRRLGRDHPDGRFRTATDDTLETDLKMFVEMHRGAEGMKGHFMRPEIATFFERIARAFMPIGWLRVDFLEIADRAIASTFGFVLDDVFYLYNSAYEPDAARLSPGLMLVSELVRESIEKGLTRFDFLRGPERYKYQLGSQALPLNNVRVLRRGPE
jgi:CelD/BcsL family acetyltransferase involved in cellulose biosynthesis